MTPDTEGAGTGWIKMKVHLPFAKDSGKTCIPFLQVSFHTDSDSLHWEHLDS